MNVIWPLRDLTIPKGVVEVMTANPPFYLTRFCISTLIHISKNHEIFFIFFAQTSKKMAQEKWHEQSISLMSALKKLTHFRITTKLIRSKALEQFQEIFIDINDYKAELQKKKVHVYTEMNGATELVNLEVFDYWIDQKTSTPELITTKNMMNRVTAKLQPIFKKKKKRKPQNGTIPGDSANR